MLTRTILACVILLTRRGNAAPTTEQRMTSSKMITEDLDSSASGYVYNQQQGLPVYYVRYTNHGSRGYYHAPDTVQYVVGAATPVASGVPETTPLLLPYATAEDVPRPTHQGTANYGNEQSLEQPVESLPRAPHYADGKIGVNEGDEAEDTGAESVEEDHGNGEREVDEEEEGDHGVDGVVHDGSAGSVEAFGHAGGYGHEGIGGSRDDGSSSFEAGDGMESTAEEYSESGVKGEKGYKTEKEYSKDEHGSNNSESEKGYYKNKGGQKKGHVDKSENHVSHDEVEKSKEGESHGQSSYHKKGQKTNGFHNVYHKDEYKKETDFYDDEHKKGHFDEYEEFNKGYKSDEGDFKEGKHRSSGHDYQDTGKKGHFDKGHSESQDQGYQAEEGERSYYSNHEDYDIEEDSKSSKEHKFREEDR